MTMWRNDRFGNLSTWCGLKDKKGSGFNVGYIDMGNYLLKITTNCNVGDKGTEKGIVEYCTVTKLPKNNLATRRRF